MTQGITEARLGKPHYDRAVEQHTNYRKSLENLGLQVTIIEEDENLPDSVFIEDTAVVTKEFAIITNPEPLSRKNETAATKEILAGMFSNLHYIKQPGTLEGGDVMQAGQHFFVGLTARTNEEGARQFDALVKQYGYHTSVVKVENILHLKTGMSYLSDNKLLVTNKFKNQEVLEPFEKIVVPDDEAYAANSLEINQTILVPAGYPETKKRIEKKGFKTISLDMSEFKKLDGGLSCLSLRF
jgi:dimethylargininase